MGTDKGLLKLSEGTFTETLVRKLQQVCSEVVISANHPHPYFHLGIPIIADAFQECGPLGGIHAVLQHVQTSSIFVVPCDLPLLSAPTFQAIMGLAQPDKITICKEHDRLHPLCGVFPVSFRYNLEKYILAGGRSVLGILSTMPVHTIDVAGMSHEFQNINTPGDYEHIISQLPVGYMRN
jgi:molybdopterin-guanine dinucleotide biosynthesis protein A